MTTQYDLPEYEVPSVDTYTDTEILEELGPASTNTYFCGPSGTGCTPV